MLVVLRAAGIVASKRRDESSRELRFDVLVPARDASRALAVLEAQNLPRVDAPASVDLVDASGMIPTDREARMKQAVGLEGDVVNALRQVPGVLEVRAAISVAASDPLSDPAARPRPKASVLVIYRPTPEQEPPLAEREVQRFVQAKLPELSSSDVDVLLLPAPDVAEAVGLAPTREDTEDCHPRRVLTVDVCARSRSRLLAAAGFALVALTSLSGLSAWMALRTLRARRAGSTASAAAPGS